MGSGGGQWDTADVITAARMNQKTLIVQATPPGTTYAGMLWYDTSTDLLKERDAADTKFIVIGPLQKGTYAARPAFGHEGRTYWATDTDEVFRDTGSAWEQIMSSVELKAGDYPTAYVGISAAATGRAAYLDASIAGRASSGAVATIDGFHDVPAQDGTADAQMRDVLGKKSDTQSTVIDNAKSLMRYVKGILTMLLSGTYGLAALETLVDDIENRITAARAGYLDYLNTNTKYLITTAMGTPTAGSIGAYVKNLLPLAPYLLFSPSQLEKLDDVTGYGQMTIFSGGYTTPEAAFDNDTGSRADSNAIDEYIELTFTLEFILTGFRIYLFDTSYSPTSRIKVQYHNGTTYVDYQTDVVNEDGAAWSSWYSPSWVHVKGKKIKIVTTALDGQGYCRIPEMEFAGICLMDIEGIISP